MAAWCACAASAPTPRSGEMGLTTGLNGARADRMRGWAYRIRTGESVRELSDWNFVTTSPEVVQARRRRPFAWELRCTNLQLRRKFSSLAGYYGDYSLAALGNSSRRNSASAPSRECVIETSRDDLRFGHGSAFEPCEQLANVFVARIVITRKIFCDHREPLCCYIVREAKAKWSRCSPRISVSLPHLHAVARQLGFRRPSPEGSSIADAALATSFVNSNCGYPDHRIVRWPRSAAERYNHE